MKYPAAFYRHYIKPVSTKPDDQRREFTFTILIALITGAAVVAAFSSIMNHVVGNAPRGADSVPITIAFALVSAVLWWAARRGRYRIGAYLLTFLIWTASVQLVLAWSFELPMAQLLIALAIAAAGVLLSTTMAVGFTLLVAASTLGTGYLQSTGVLTPNVHWMTGKLEFSDVVGQVVLYLVIGGILWLSNREIDSLFHRARASEDALMKERDQLEVTVAKRTQDLERTQMERILELQNFAEFGRVSASLLHDLASPLTAAAINIEEAGSKQNSKLLAQAMASLEYIERYLTTARKQLANSEALQVFTVGDEVSGVLELVRHQAVSAHVGLELQVTNNGKVYGSVVNFHRVIANIVVNAIQAYDGKKRVKPRVLVEVKRQNNFIRISISDNGTGINSVDLPHIFDDFYSTKKQVGRGLGLGLANAKRVIEKDYKGAISVTSSVRAGTTFTIEIPLHEKTATTKPTKRPKLPKTSATTKR